MEANDSFKKVDDMKEFLTKIINAIREDDFDVLDYNYYGVRFHRDEILSVGDTLYCSKVWVDGNMTDELLDGTCAIDIRTLAEKDWTAEEIIDFVDQYTYGHGEVVVCAGNKMTWGEDRYEIVIENAVKVA